MSGAERLSAGSDEILLGELLAGARLKDAAEAAKMSYATARRRADDPGFVERLEAATRDLGDAISRRIMSAQAKAIATLEHLAEHADTESSRIAAARAVLQHGPAVQTALEVRRRVEAIETAQGIDPRTGWRAGRAAA